MKLKSLLLGSTAALFAVTGAQAADAVVVEPEPVEYVRVCDAYGSGFFFIPGTETCLRFNGYIRSYYAVAHIDNETTGEELSFTDWASRARMQVTANSETDWGTLSAFFRIDTDLRGAGGQATVIDRGLISLAGFRAGLGANYWTTNHGFAGVNLAGIVADNPGFITIEDGPYAGTTTAATMFDYTWAGDGFSITAGVQDVNGINRLTNVTGLHDYYAGFNYSADWGGLAFTWIHDGNAVEQTALGAATGAVGGDAWKVSADIDLSEFIPGGLLHVMYMEDGDYATSYVSWAGAFANTESILQVSFQMDLTDELQLAAQYSDVDGQLAGQDGYSAGIGLNWFPAAAPGFTVYTSYAFGEADNVNGTLATGIPGGRAGVVNVGDNVSYDAWVVRVRRNF